MSDQQKILACPFCGSPGAICCLEDEPGSPASFWVNCSCGIETRERRTEAEAITLWNTRALPDEIERLREQLASAKEALRKIAQEDYKSVDEQVRWNQPMMIWQSVAQTALNSLTDDLREDSNG